MGTWLDYFKLIKEFDSMKYVDLTPEEEHSLLLQLDQYSISDIGFKDEFNSLLFRDVLN